MPRRAWEGSLIVLAAASLGSCGAKVLALVDAQNRSLMIVPLATDTSRHDRIEPFSETNRTGRRIATLAAQRIAAHAKGVSLFPPDILARAAGDMQIDRWLQERPHAKIRETLGGLDLLCLGIIVQAQINDPGSDIVQGRMRLRVAVHDLAAGTIRPVELEVSYPVSPSLEPRSEKDIYDGLVQVAAKAVAEIFYPHATQQAHRH